MPSASRKSQPTRKKAVLVIFPAEVVDALDRLAKQEDTDRSKFIRRAVRNAMRRTV
jgi:metal-responsive CopG/Arc/MetJ family transcriptional regulator